MWTLIEADLGDVGVDVGDQAVLWDRSWRWGATRILALLDTPVAGYARLPIPNDDKHERVLPIWRTRVQSHFFGAKEG